VATETLLSDPSKNPESTREVDETVLARLRAGEIAALDELFAVYGDRVFGVCLGILAHHADAEDATQEVFLRAFEQAARFSARSRFSTWLLRLTANHTLNLAKARGRRRRLDEPMAEGIASTSPPPDRGVIQRERRDELARHLQKLSVERRQVLILREMEGLSYTELAEVLDVPIGTVTSRLIRARQQLRGLMHDFRSDTPEPG